MIALVAVGVVSVLALVGTTWITQLNNLGRRYMIKDAPKIFLMNLKGRLNNDASWARTVGAADSTSDLGCVADPTRDCCSIVDRPFATYDQSGNLFYDPRVTSSGFNYSGQPCPGFDAVNGNEECPFQAEVVWSGVNNGTSPLCKDVRVKVSFRIKTPRGDFPINSDEVTGRDFIRGAGEGTLASHCLALGGRFDQTSNDCTLRGATTPCGPGTFMKGFDSAGNTVCAAVSLSNSPSCPFGQAIQNANFVGGGVATGCNLYPLTPPCPANWHMEGPYCYFNFRNPCSASNGTGMETWMGAGWACRAVSCNSGFNLMGGACVQFSP